MTIWLTIIPKLSILILLLELYLQIDGFEGYFVEYFPLINYVSDFSSLPDIVSNFFQKFGGVENYEAYIGVTVYNYYLRYPGKPLSLIQLVT